MNYTHIPYRLQTYALTRLKACLMDLYSFLRNSASLMNVDSIEDTPMKFRYVVVHYHIIITNKYNFCFGGLQHVRSTQSVGIKRR